MYNLEKELRRWLTKIASQSVLPESIEALNFGLFENAEGYYSVYLIGSKNYDENSDDWACLEDFIPKYQYFHVKNDVISNLLSQEFLELMKSTLTKVLKEERFKNSLFDAVDYISIGFDDGELELINF